MATAAVPDKISEEYYQISEAILESFPKYRPPLDFFVFKTDIAQLVAYSRKGDRLSNEQVEETRRLCSEGDLFVARSDHPIYSQHIVKQLDLVLVDQNLKEAEVADICLRALDLRLADFLEQPVKALFDFLYSDIQVITEYLWNDMHRMRLFIRRLHRGEYSLQHHCINTFCIGLWLFVESKGEELRRKDFDQAALSLLLHDVGMVKIPSFILSKTTPLKSEEKDKIPPHTLLGYKIMHKLDQSFDTLRQATLEHHERLDGSGYPQHSKDISSFGRLVAVADAFSAMIQTRPYAAAKDCLGAARELTEEKNRFDFAYSSKLLGAFISEAFGRMK
ncbi:MAG: HD domain-containing protein [Desulfovibrio sp.]|jgi:response regulator RpfG family c-di-GMP phosphodiesterase|nr:HD domain-containing protein [Desulfovibrio sp.]